MIFIYILWNYISVPCYHLPHRLSQGTFLYALLHIPVSTKIIAIITENSIHNMQNDRYQHIEISVATSLMLSWNIWRSSTYDDSNILWSIMTCTTISIFTKFFYDKWHTDLQQCSIDKWIHKSYNIYLPYSDIHYHLLCLLYHSSVPTGKKSTSSGVM